VLIAKKILLVEDDESISELLTDFLSEEGYRTTVCSTGQKALIELSTNNYAVMILDMHLLDMTANEMLVHMLEQAIKTPVILVSADATALKYGEQVQAIVPKPFNLFNLLNTLQRIIDTQ
jgi:DNA-binding response OmpR family regulator